MLKENQSGLTQDMMNAAQKIMQHAEKVSIRNSERLAFIEFIQSYIFPASPLQPISGKRKFLRQISATKP